MRLLFAITILCFCAVLWVALALARRIRLGQVLTAKPRASQRPAVREFFEAGEFRTPRPLHLDQEIFQQKPRRPLAEISSFSQHPAPAAGHSAIKQGSIGMPRASQPIPIRPSTAYATLFGQNISIAQIDTYRSAAPLTVPQSHAQDPDSALGTPSADFAGRRIPPQSDRASGLRRRIDLSHFNQDMSNLADPYTSPLRGSGTQGPAPADNRFSYKH